MSAKKSPTPKANQVYVQLREGILKARLRPGTHLREERLAADFRVSRTPIREALRRLERDGLVRLIPHVGAQVQEVSLQDLMETLEFRRCLEPYAARIAARRVTPPVERKLRKLRKAFGGAARGNPSPVAIGRHSAVDRQLHGLIMDLAVNRRIAQAIEELRDTIQQYRYLGFAAPQRLPRSTREHLGVIDALLRRDAARAEAAMSYHLEQFADDLQECLLSRLRQRGTDGDAGGGGRPRKELQRPRASRGQASARSGPQERASGHRDNGRET